MAHRVDATVESDQPSAIDPSIDRAFTQPKPPKLPARNHPMLPTRYLGDPRVDPGGTLARSSPAFPSHTGGNADSIGMTRSCRAKAHVWRGRWGNSQTQMWR